MQSPRNQLTSEEAIENAVDLVFNRLKYNQTCNCFQCAIINFRNYAAICDELVESESQPHSKLFLRDILNKVLAKKAHQWKIGEVPNKELYQRLYPGLFQD